MTVIERPTHHYMAGLLASKPSPGRRPIYPALLLPGCLCYGIGEGLLDRPPAGM
jgi:hypothetical protein